MSCLVRFPTVFAGVLIASLTLSSFARDAEAMPSPVIVKVGDLDLSKPDEAAQFQIRVKRAIRQLCIDEPSTSVMAQYRYCEAAVVEEILAKLSEHQRQSLKVGMAGVAFSVR